MCHQRSWTIVQFVRYMKHLPLLAEVYMDAREKSVEEVEEGPRSSNVYQRIVTILASSDLSSFLMLILIPIMGQAFRFQLCPK